MLLACFQGGFTFENVQNVREVGKLRHRTGLPSQSCQTILWLKQIQVSFKSRQKIRFDGCLSASKCSPYKAWRTNLSAISPTRNLAFMYARYAYAYSLNLDKKIIVFFFFRESIFIIESDKYFALYWCFCLGISFILLLTKWSEIGERSECESTDLSWDFSPGVLQFHPRRPRGS